jgi:hypothetical protein
MIVRRPRRNRGPGAAAALAALIAVAAFLPAVSYGFTYDDHWTIEGNPAFAHGLAPVLRAVAMGRAALRGVPDATRPLMVVSVWLDHRLFGFDPAGYHLHSLLLYGVCSALASLAIFSVTRSVRAATLGGAVFAVLPIHSEVVAAVNYREDLYAGISVFLTLACLFAPRRRKASMDDAVLVGAPFFLGLLGKESAIALVPVVAVIACSRPRARAWLQARRPAVAGAAVALAVWGLWRGWLRFAGRDDVPLVLVHRGPVERVLRTARYAVRAALDGLFPIAASPEYAPEPSPSPLWILGAAAICVAIVWLARRRATRQLAIGLSIAAAAPLVTSPLLSPINERADRYVFIGTLGGALVWGVLGDRLAARMPAPLRMPAFVAALGVLAFFARRAAAPWHDDLSLWQAATLQAPDSARAWTGLSRTLRIQGDLDGADRAVARAIVLDPTFLRARVTRVYNRLVRGDVEGARADIDDIRRRGGARQLGMRRAAECAAMERSAAARCAGAPGLSAPGNDRGTGRDQGQGQSQSQSE